MKVNISLHSPVAGTIIAANPAFELAPETVNKDPYGRRLDDRKSTLRTGKR